MHFTKQQADREYWALAQLLSQGRRESYQDEIESSAPDWSEARRLYVAIRHICESGSVKGSDLQTFYDFDEWFMSLDDALQAAITGDEESRDSEATFA
jgi:hypothetical protein